MLTLEENDRVLLTVWFGTRYSGIQVVRDSREGLRDVLGESVLQLVFVVAENLVILHQQREPV